MHLKLIETHKLTPEQKYKAKNFIETILYRTGDVIGTWAVRFMVAAVGLSGTSMIMVPFACIWGGIALWLGWEYKRRDTIGKASA